MASSSLRLCETFLKRSWHRAATVFAVLIALSGVPVDSQARAAGLTAGHALKHAAGFAAVQASPADASAAEAQAPPANPAPTRAAQPAPTPPVESTQPAAPPAQAAPHAAPGEAPAGDHAAPPAPMSTEPAHGQPPAHGPPAAGAPPPTGAHGAGAAQPGGEAHPESIWPTIARLFNFAVLVGGLVYLLRSPLAQHLASRSQQIRGGLETARATTATATAQLAELDRRLQALPVELESLRVKGVEEIAAEERRIQAHAEAERTRLIDDMQRDVAVRIRVARKALTEHAADLAIGLAADRVRQSITDADQARLIDRYTTQVKDIHG